MDKIRIKKPVNWQSKAQKLFEDANEILDDYQEQGYQVTLRQLHYQLVSKNFTPNTDGDYNRLSRVMREARNGGLVDWDMIVDRTRTATIPAEFKGIDDLLDAAINSYRKDRHVDQFAYVEVWTEKDALAGLLEPITRKYHVHLVVDRGYSSASAMFEAAKRFSIEADIGSKQPKNGHILYLGDHDPSGMDMIRDIRDRMSGFGIGNSDMCPLSIKRIAITEEQIEEYNAPPNHIKKTDTRASGYLEEHGEGSWEVDAIPPEALNQLLEQEIEKIIDMKKYNKIIKEEEEDKKELSKKLNKI